MANLRNAETSLKEVLPAYFGQDRTTKALDVLRFNEIGTAFLTARTLVNDIYATDTATFTSLDSM